MGWAQRARLERHRNGEEPRPDPPGPVEHAAWCQQGRYPEMLTDPACTCYPIPALRCEACRAVFVAADNETAIEFHRRVRLHAMVHPDGNPSFTQGRVDRLERRQEPAPPDDVGELGGSDRRRDDSDPRRTKP